MKSRTVSIVFAGAILICVINVALAFTTGNHAVAELRSNNQVIEKDHKTEALDTAPVFGADLDTVLYQDWESGIGNWWVDNGVWEVGIPTVGPDSAYSDSMCAGTVLNGDYPPSANTRLISPQIILPPISSDKHIKLKFWHWFRIHRNWYYGVDKGWVQISVEGGDWQTLAGPMTGWSTAWTQGYVDLSAYADSTVRIAFYFTSGSLYHDNGWYIDDILITVGVPVFNNPEDFEQGTGDWSADNGLWEVGIPTVGPDSCHSGQNCAGTLLDSDYTGEANTRLVSPEITLTPEDPANPIIGLYFWHWFRINENVYYGNDKGWVQISVEDGDWQTLAGPISGWSTQWTQRYVDLSAYEDSTVRIAFYFTSGTLVHDNGWYIDDVRIEGINSVSEYALGTNVTKSFGLYQNHPNPFRPTTEIRYTLPRDCDVKLEVFNSLGQKIATLVDQNESAGYKLVRWDASTFSAGIYFYRLRAGDFTDMKKMVILK